MTFLFRNNTKIFYETHGSGEALILLQGNSASSAHLKLTGDIAYFQKFAQVITFDYRGTGQSIRQTPWPLDWYRQCADDAYHLLTALQIQQCHVIGSSGGAIVAFWLAALYPQSVISLIADSFSLNFKGNMAEEIRKTRQNITVDQEKFWRLGHGDDWREVIQADTNFLARFAAAQTGSQIDLPL